ncbi:MAG: type III pantothenate kinase [Planctomycetales bacterium]
MAGFQLSARALHRYTALLPLIGIDELANEPHPPLGRDTRQALRSGLFWGQLGAVKELIARLSVGEKEPALLLTGGGGPLLAPHLPHARHEPHLGLRGLALSAGTTRGDLPPERCGLDASRTGVRGRFVIFGRRFPRRACPPAKAVAGNLVPVHPVIPAEAGIQPTPVRAACWMPAFAGMTRAADRSQPHAGHKSKAERSGISREAPPCIGAMGRGEDLKARDEPIGTHSNRGLL